MSQYAVMPFADYEAACNAVRSKTGRSLPIKSTQLASEITGIQVGGTEITDGIVVKTRDTDGYAVDIDYYGTSVQPYTFGTNGTTTQAFIWRRLRTITFKNAVTLFGANAFDRIHSSFQITLPDTVTTIGNYCFQRAASVSNVVIPQSVISIGLGAFYGSSISAYTDPYMNAQASYGGASSNPQVLYGCTNLHTVQFGSAGHPVTLLNRYILSGCTQSNLTVTAYCRGDYADTLQGILRNGATNAVIILKAAESTVYNGRAFSAGDTMVVSEVSV